MTTKTTLYQAVIVTAQSDQNSIFCVSENQLCSLIHNKLDHAVLQLLEQDVAFIHDALASHQLQSHQLSYINAVLIQSQNQLVISACKKYQNDARFRLFSECQKLSEYFKNVCDNCK